MSRSKEYQRLLNSKRWKRLRAWYLNLHPLCERCIEEGEAAGIPGGYVSSAVDVHHIVPVESAKSPQEMERLCYSVSNLRALCITCHKATHREMMSQTREGHQQTAKSDLDRWVARHSAKKS